MTALGSALVALLMCLPLAGFAAEYIESFHSDIEIRRNGDLHVTETIRAHAEGRAIRRGIFRDFPTRYTDARGRSMSVDFEVESVKRDGVSEPFRIKDRSNGQRVYIGDSKVYLSPGPYEYTLTYLTSRQLGFFADFDELYWNVTGTDWAFPINSASARVTLPGAATGVELSGYTGPHGSVGKNLKYERVGQ